MKSLEVIVGFLDSGFRVRVLGLGFRVFGLEFKVSCFWFMCLGFGVCSVWGFGPVGFRIQDSQNLGISVLCFRVLSL